jgi:YCII-related domain
MKEDEQDLTREEADALRGLASPAALPEALEDRVVLGLRERGLLAGGSRPWRARLLAAAAALALFAAGLFIGQGRRMTPAEPSALPRYVLFLYDAPDEAALDSGQMAARVEEYRNWAVAVRRGGSVISGEKLEAESRLLGSGSAAHALGGYFVISARDYASAVALAQTCPHLKHGGSIEVRPIAPT